MGTPVEEGREAWAIYIYIFQEIKTEHFSNLLKNNNLHIQEIQQNLSNKNVEVHKQIHYIKMLKVKEKNIESIERKRLLTYQGIWIRLATNFLTNTMEDIEQWDNIFKVVK